MMDRTTIRDAIGEANRFITAASEVLEEMDTNKEWDYTEGRHMTKPVDKFYSGRKSTGELRRRSMDLTRALADLRRAQ